MDQDTVRSLRFLCYAFFPNIFCVVEIFQPYVGEGAARADTNTDSSRPGNVVNQNDPPPPTTFSSRRNKRFGYRLYRILAVLGRRSRP